MEAQVECLSRQYRITYGIYEAVVESKSTLSKPTLQTLIAADVSLKGFIDSLDELKVINLRQVNQPPPIVQKPKMAPRVTSATAVKLYEELSNWFKDHPGEETNSRTLHDSDFKHATMQKIKYTIDRLKKEGLIRTVNPEAPRPRRKVMAVEAKL
jgi:hypothetical protein